MLPCILMAQDDNYNHVNDDLSNGTELKEVANRAYENAEAYWEYAHGHERDGHEHDGTDEELSAGEAVTEIYTNAGLLQQTADPASLDIIQVTLAVIDAWPDCEDTFDAVRAAVSLIPARADEIVANVAVKRDCNCNNGGIWLDQRPHERIRVDLRHRVLEVPVQCSCSQVAMYAGVAGLPENQEYNEGLSEEEKARLMAAMTERVTTITERTVAMQSNNDWDCGCTDINIVASMQGINDDELRGSTYDKIATKYADEAGDTGLVVDSFGIVGLQPMEYWGSGEYVSRGNSLRRDTEVYRGDNLILDPFHPSTEFKPHGDRNFDDLGTHRHSSGNTPTDLFISEYVEGWNQEALALPENERDPEQRNRVVELYNGSDNIIDLSDDLYFLEIYAGPQTEVTSVESPPVLVRKKVSLQSDVTFDFDKSDIRTDADEDLRKVVEVLNAFDIISEIVIAGHTCDIGDDEYNVGLSKRRAESVKDYLQQIGLNVDTIRTEGRGEAEPRVANDSIANRSLNRRVDLTFVTRAGEEIKTTVSAGDKPGTKKYEYDFLIPVPGGVVGDVEQQTVENQMVSGDYYDGDMKPRQVIGLNGTIEPGETYVVAFNDSDDTLTDKASLVTDQLDFKPNETLVLRRLGGEMALNCRVYGYAHTLSYPVFPPILLPLPAAPSNAALEIVSPN